MLISKLMRDHYFPSRLIPTVFGGVKTRPATLTEEGAPTVTANDYSAFIQEYKLDRDDYDHRQKAGRTALSLIYASVDESIRESLQQFLTPADAWICLNEQYKMSDSKRLNLQQG